MRPNQLPSRLLASGPLALPMLRDIGSRPALRGCCGQATSKSKPLLVASLRDARNGMRAKGAAAGAGGRVGWELGGPTALLGIAMHMGAGAVCDPRDRIAGVRQKLTLRSAGTYDGQGTGQAARDPVPHRSSGYRCGQSV